MNAVEIEEAVSDLAAQPFDAAEFPFAFLAAFGMKDTTIRRLRKGESNASDVPHGVLQRNNIHIAAAAPGEVGAALAALRQSPKTASAKANKSDHPMVAAHRELIHKIGVTGGKVETRIADAVHDATYLLADVEVVASYKLAAINRTKLEALFHRLFAPAQLDLTIQDRFGHPVRPREWFLVPLPVIDEAVQRIRDGSITNVVYDPKSARLVEQ